MVTLKDVAQECGVSFSTVSKALKNSPEISEDKRKFIQEKAVQMGYYPNFAARTLRTNRTYNIGVIFEDKTGSGFQHQYFAKIISGLQTLLHKSGYEMTFTSHLEDKNFDYYNHSKSRGFDGVAILSTDFERPGIKALVQSEIPTVTLDYSYDDNHCCVMSDNKNGMKELTEFVISKGHKKIAMIHGENTCVTQERLAVFNEVCNQHNIEIPSEYFAQGLYHDPITSTEATAVLLELPSPPTCILYPDDYSALGGIRELSSRGIIPGKNISITGYDGIMLTSMMVPPLTTYEQNGEKIGQKIAESLLNQIENNRKTKAEKFFVGGRLLKGGTVVSI